MLRTVDQKHLESFEMWCWRKMEKISWTDHVRNEEVLLRVKGQRKFYYYRYSALGPVWAETRAQSVDWYSSGTLHPGQVLRGSLPLLSPSRGISYMK